MFLRLFFLNSIKNMYSNIFSFRINNFLIIIYLIGLPVDVPLWLGINLKQRGKCRLIPPEWMDAEKLTEKKDEESQSKVTI